jgi:RNA 2',3'-cyclic 3'-phosphodiesterase
MAGPGPERRPPTARPDARVRLFVALALPAAAREALAGWAREALGGVERPRGGDPPRPGESPRLVPAESLHVTLAFLGWREPGAATEIADVALAAVAGLESPLLTPAGVLALPPRAPRVLAVELDDAGGRAGAVQDAVERALVAAGLHEPEGRPFRPHVTVARVRRGGRLRRAASAIAPPPADPLAAREVVLYRSELRPGGARYTRLAGAGLRVR